MKTYCGKFSFETYYFSLANMDDGGTITFNGLLDCKNVDDETIIYISMEINNNIVSGTIRYEDESEDVFSYPESQMSQFMEETFGTYFTGIGVIQLNYVTNSTFIDYVKNSIDKTDTTNAIFLFRTNSSCEHIEKDLIFIESMKIKYTRAINYRRLQIDIKRTVNDEKFNYVYLTVLNRYYFVDDMLLTNDYALISLSEDVLMSFADLIRLQTAYVERNQYNIDSDKVDDLVTFDYDKNKNYISITPTNDFLTFNVTPLSRSNFVLINVWGIDS